MLGFTWHCICNIFSGLSVRDLILQFRHKAVILFKLLLLERRLVFYRSPVQPLCAAILSLLSLHPGMIERGLRESACVKWAFFGLYSLEDRRNVIFGKVEGTEKQVFDVTEEAVKDCGIYCPSHMTKSGFTGLRCETCLF